ncbi:MAG: tetratricopeptide repeat protein [Litorivicinus sp.]
MVRLSMVLGALVLTGCASGVRVPPPIIDGTQNAGEQDRIRSSQSQPATSVAKPSAVATKPVASQTQPVQVAKIESQPVVEQPSTTPISEPVLELLETADQQASGGNNDAAMATLERALRLAPREPEIYYQMGRLRLEMGQASESEQLALKAVDLAPDSFVRRDSWNLVALARERAGNIEGAKAARAKARGL